MSATIKREIFGKLADGRSVELFTLTNRDGLVAKITNFGTIITELHVPDRQGQLGDVVLGFSKLDGYLADHPYFGCTVGRFANRIAGGRFELDGKTYNLAVNNGPNHLHGGIEGFSKKLWAAKLNGRAIEFSYRSPNGEEGYPGNMDVQVTMQLTDANELRLDYRATTDQPTILNLTNHSYFNLAGKGTILDHELKLGAKAFTPVDANLIPTGEIRPVAGTPMDFTRPAPIGSRFKELGGSPAGYDHNFVIDNYDAKTPRFAASVRDPQSGRVVEAWTTEPGIQFYTANFLDGSLTGKGGQRYVQHCGFCLETQHFPDSINKPQFPSVILRPGAVYTQTTIYRFLKQ